jgi:murein DD-endopeptidase MepM/ murein hydrolase activator NlpD
MTMELSARKLVLAAMLAPWIAGCMPDNPQTVFNWDVKDTASHAPARNNAKLYAYRDMGPRVPVPTPRPDPDYVRADAAPYRTPKRAESYTRSYLPSHSHAQGGADASLAFAWPVKGSVISDFGSTADGSELKDYGNLVLIRHADGYVTAYAHADRLVVQRGDLVAKGQVIGYAGKTGDVNSPQLHFEIRHETTPVDPRPLLVASARSS